MMKASLSKLEKSYQSEDCIEKVVEVQRKLKEIRKEGCLLEIIIRSVESKYEMADSIMCSRGKNRSRV